MNKIVDYIKTHKFTTILLVIVIYYFFNGFLSRSMISVSKVNTNYPNSYKISGISPAVPSMDITGEMGSEYTPAPVTQERKVVTNSNYSLLVKDVSDTINKIRTKVTSVTGYVIDINITRGVSSESAYLSLRIPTKSVEEVTNYLRSVSVKVVSENIKGMDITDQYTDVEGRISELQAVKTKLEQIMNEAKTSDEMLRVFNQISSINNQIDSYKGRLKYMDTASSTSMLTVALSTDELSLPYSPAEPWRPEVIFKTAVRSLLTTLQSIGSLLIWLAVYLPLVALVILIFLVIKRVRRTRKIK